MSDSQGRPHQGARRRTTQRGFSLMNCSGHRQIKLRIDHDFVRVDGVQCLGEVVDHDLKALAALHDLIFALHQRFELAVN